MTMGIIFGESNADYHASGAVSHTKMESLLNPPGLGARYNPGLFHALHIAKTIKRESEAFNLGKAVHALQLEGPKVFDELFVVSPHESFRTNKAKAWKKAQTKTIVSAEEMRADTGKIQRMMDAMMANPDAAMILDKSLGRPEVTFRKKMASYAIQCRADQWIMDIAGKGVTLPGDPDTFHPRIIGDIKTTDSLSHFHRNWAKFGYHRAAAFYTEVEREVVAEQFNFDLKTVPYASHFFIVVETQEPFDCMVFRIDPIALELARREMVKDLRYLKTCYDTGNWKNPTGGIHTLSLKDYEAKQSLEATEG